MFFHFSLITGTSTSTLEFAVKIPCDSLLEASKHLRDLMFALDFGAPIIVCYDYSVEFDDGSFVFGRMSDQFYDEYIMQDGPDV